VERVGWRDAYLLLGAVGVVVLLVSAALVRAAGAVTGAEHVPLRPRLRQPAYLRLYAAGLLLSVALFVPFVHLPSYAQADGVGPVAAAALVGVIGAASVAGRLALGALAARAGTLRPTRAASRSSLSASRCGWSRPATPAWSCSLLLLGIGYGGFVALGPPLVAEIFGVHGLGGLLGVLYTSAALGSAVGPPVAGVLISSSGDYDSSIAASLVATTAALGIVLTVGRTRGAAVQ
jgi:predicted MFS family arabinose efflux permease